MSGLKYRTEVVAGHIVLGRGALCIRTEGVPEGALEDTQERMPV